MEFKPYCLGIDVTVTGNKGIDHNKDDLTILGFFFRVYVEVFAKLSRQLPYNREYKPQFEIDPRKTDSDRIK